MAAQQTQGLVPLSKADGWEVPDGEPHIRGWEVDGADGRRLGKVDDLLVSIAARKVRYLIVDVDDDISGTKDRRVLLPIGTARLDRDDEKVIAPGITAAGIAGLPAYNPSALTREHEEQLRTRLGGAGIVGAGGAAASSGKGKDFYAHEHFDENRFFGPGHAPREEVVIRKHAVSDTGNAEADTRKERVDIDEKGRVRGKVERDREQHDR